MYGMGLGKGLLVTLRNALRRPFTVQYPEERVTQHPRFRGEEFAWYEERCTGCASCAKYCPLGIIKIVTGPSGTAPQDGDKYEVQTFDIDIGRCMFCGLCVEACPYDALFLGQWLRAWHLPAEQAGPERRRPAQRRKAPQHLVPTPAGGCGLQPPQGHTAALGRRRSGELELAG